jgi:hypothetical protein
LLAQGKLLGVEVPWLIEHKAVHLAPEWGARTASLAAMFQVIGLVLVLLLYWWRGAAEGVRFSGAAILAYLSLGKVLSPQYLIWIFPFVAVLGGWTGDRARWLLLFCCITTALIYPGPGFAQLLEQQSMAILIMNLRNILLLGLLGLLVFGPDAEVRASAPLDIDGRRDER